LPWACWPWQAGTFGDGYGRFTFDGSYYQAHRLAWALAYHEDPHEALVLHHCANPECVNPAHLYLGDQRNNMADAKVHAGSDVFSSLGEENPNAKLTTAEVREIRERYTSGDVRQYELAEEFDVAQSLISMVVNEVQWSHA
jgi:hypothetical protein